jgi:hypothetical protein
METPNVENRTKFGRIMRAVNAQIGESIGAWLKELKESGFFDKIDAIHAALNQRQTINLDGLGLSAYISANRAKENNLGYV